MSVHCIVHTSTETFENRMQWDILHTFCLQLHSDIVCEHILIKTLSIYSYLIMICVKFVFHVFDFTHSIKVDVVDEF